ncbi:MULTISPECIES: winged helix-turn-helix transcriptional regulator [unclassified Nocardiopsis]|uniref:winged helix-turn-helix transcriptional regulator n=1 Tax=unclassified Nocardiopsis TaxID=2649073 RepID=UPI0013588807|nr:MULTISPECIES: winged helix-turn-helix transcriptional regulator [unclassified Nocardiopsis]
MARTRRSYNQYCGLASALDIIGERWTLLIVRELLLGPARYRDLLDSLPGIGTNLLAERLKFLAEQGVIRRAAGENERGYELTEHGERLREPVLQIAHWGLEHLGAPDEGQEVRPHWGFLAVQSMLDPSRAGDADECYEFRVDGTDFHIRVEGGRATAHEGRCEAPAMLAVTDARTFVEIGSGNLNPFMAVVSGRLSLDGDEECVQRAMALLGLIEGAEAPRKRSQEAVEAV